MKINTTIITIIISIIASLLIACQPLDIQTAEDNITTITPDDNFLYTPVINIPQQNNSAPVTEDPIIPTKTIKEGEVVQISQNLAIDPDGDQLRYTFPAPFNSNGVWQTVVGDAGDYTFPIKVSDGQVTAELKIRIVVEAVNQAPQIANFEDITVYEGELIELNPIVTDRENDTITIRYSGFMSGPTFQTTYESAGVYTVTLMASDGFRNSSKEITITILDKNRAPVLEDFAAKIATAGDVIIIRPAAYDPDGDNLTFSFGAPFNQNGEFATQQGDEGDYNVTVTASDGQLSTTKIFMLQVRPQNRPPVITVAPVITVQEGTTFTMDVTASDPDGDAVTLTFEGFMQSRTRYITYNDAGEHLVTITASDGRATTRQQVTIIVEDVNRPPQFTGDIFG